MTTRQMIRKRAINNRKIVPIHSIENNYRKNNRSKNFKQHKFEAGIQALNDSDYIEAIKQFTLIKPNTTISLYLTGSARLELQHYLHTQEAIDDFNKCIELIVQPEQPTVNIDVWYKRGLAYYNIKKYDEAIRDYTEFINRCRALGEQGIGELARGLIARGRTYQVIYELDLSLKDINEANRLTNNKNPYYLCCRASVYISIYDLKKALEDIETAMNYECNKNVDALLQRAIVLADLGRYNAALEDLGKALTLSSKPTEQAEICYRCGLNEYILNSKDQAYQWFRRAIILHPYHAQAYYQIGIIQREKGQYKEALKHFNRAFELSPNQSEILIERSLVNQHLGKSEDAIQDQKHAQQLNSSSYAIIKLLADRIKILREERDQSGASIHNHLDLAIAYDGLISQKKHQYYKLAVMEYRAAIEKDKKCLYPQSYALLALCHKKMNKIIDAHNIHLEFYNVVDKYKSTNYYWKTYLLDVKDKMDAGELDPHLDEESIKKLIHMELNRRKKNIDEETFRNDYEDEDKNQLGFYQQMRIDLANLLTAISILNLDSNSIINNVENTTNKIGKMIELIIRDELSIPVIESTLNSTAKVNMKNVQKMDSNMLKVCLQTIGNVGDMVDQLDVAQLVARHLCTRYRSQLICLKSDNQYSNENQQVKEVESSWNCCGISSWFFSKKSKFSDEKNILRKLSTFAIAFIIHTINSGTIRMSSNEQSFRKDKLATSLVLIICHAHLNPSYLSSVRHEYQILPINTREIPKMLRESQSSYISQNLLPTEWNLYAFFRAPGIYYYSNNDTEKIAYYNADPLMMSNLYGYRLGIREEVDLFKKLD